MSELAIAVFDVMNRNKEVFFVIHLIDEAKMLATKKRVNDPDKEMKCELMEGREGFLNLSKENHLQFNTLRHAKYSTMMLLYYLRHGPGSEAEFTCTTKPPCMIQYV